MESKNSFRRFWQLIKLDRHDIVSIYFYAIFAGFLQLSVPIGVQAIIGFVLGASMVTSIYVLIILVVSGVFLAGILQINQMKINEKIQQKIFVRYAMAYAEKIPKIDIYKSLDYYLPEKVNRFCDTLTVQKGLSKLLLDIPSAAIQILLGLLLLAVYHPIFIVFGVLLVGILWLIVKFSSGRGLETSLQESKQKYAVIAWFQEIAKAIKPFKNSQDAILDIKHTDELVTDYLKYRTNHFKILVFQFRVLVGFKVIITTSLLSAGVYLLINQSLNIGEFIAAEIVILMIINSTEKIIKSLESVYDVVTGLVKLATVIESPEDEDGSIDFSEQQMSVELKDLTFAFGKERAILKNVNAEIPAGSIVCVTGVEGSGKSTLLRIIAHLYTSYDGNVLVNNIPLHNYKLENIRKRVGIYFGQEDIFSGTVLDNITMGRTEITSSQVMHIAEEAGMGHFMQSLPLGFQTMIKNGGATLSNSIRHKILILRALCHNPNLVVMEDPFQGLRDAVKVPLIKYLLKRNDQQTLIVASTDDSFMAGCDYILRLSEGAAILEKQNNI